MQHDSKRWFATSSTQAVQSTTADKLAAPMVLDDALLSLIGGGVSEGDITEPPTPVNSEAGPHDNW